MSRGIIAIISFSGSSLGVRIGLGSSLSELKECVCKRWSAINHCFFEMYVIRDKKDIIVSTDEEMQCIICSTILMGENTVNVYVRFSFSLSSTIDWIDFRLLLVIFIGLIFIQCYM